MPTLLERASSWEAQTPDWVPPNPIVRPGLLARAAAWEAIPDPKINRKFNFLESGDMRMIGSRTSISSDVPYEGPRTPLLPEPPSAADQQRKFAMDVLGEPSVVDRATNAVAAVAQGTADWAASVPEMLAAVENRVDAIFGNDKDLKDYALFRLGESIRNLPLDGGQLDPRQPFTNALGEAVGGLVPTLATAAATGGFSTITLAAQGAAQAGVSSYRQARDAGASEETARLAGGVSAALGGASMSVGGWNILRTFDSAVEGKLAEGIIRNSATVGAQNAVITAVQQLGENQVAKLYDKHREAFDGVLQAAGIGGILGSVAHAVVSVAPGRVPQSRPLEHPQPVPPPLQLGEAEIPKVSPIGPATESLTTQNVLTPEGARGVWEQAPRVAAEIVGKEGAFPRSILPKLRSLIPEINAENFQVAQRGQLAELLRATDPRKEMTNAGTVRSDQAQVAQEGIEAQGGENARRENLQRGAEAGPSPGDAGVRREAQGDVVTLGEVARPPQELPLAERPQPPLPDVPGQTVMVEPTTEQMAAGFGPQLISVDGLKNALKSGLRAATTILKQFRSRGELPKEAFEAKIESEGEYRAIVKQAEFAQSDLRRAVRADFGSDKLTEQGRQQIDAALRSDPTALATLPETTRQAVTAARNVADSLSRRIVETVPMSERLQATFAENEGIYLRRTYAAHNDPRWMDKVPQVVRDRFKQTLIDSHPEYNNAQLDQTINALLYDANQAANPLAFWTNAKLGSKDLSGLMKRKDLSEAFRDLLGEEKDPFTNFTRTTMYQARLIANQQFLGAVREAGMGKWLWEKGDPKIDPRAMAEISSPGSEVMNPLNGLYTFPEIAREFQRAQDSVRGGFFGRAYYMALMAAKAAKTVESHVGIMRNLMSNPAIMVRNGVFKFWNVRDPFRAIAADLGWDKTPPSREYLLDLQRLGVLDQSTGLQEMNLIAKGAFGRTLDDALAGPDYQTLRKLKGIGIKGWQSGDNFYKVLQFETERPRYADAHPEWSTEQVKQRAAEIVRLTQPTGSMIPRAVRAAQRLPLTETFIGWSAEILRTSFNALKLASEELADPRTRGIGMSRLIGSALVAAGIPAIKYAYSSLFGINQENDKDAARFLYDYQENAPFLMLSNPVNGKLNYVDLSFSDPHSILSRPITALLRGEGWEDKFWRAALELGKTFAGENIIAEVAIDLARNRDKNGYAIWNPSDTPIGKAKAIGKRAAQPFVPASGEALYREYKALKGIVDPSGRSYDPTVETIAQFGLRAQQMDIRQRLSRKAAQFTKDTEDATALYRSKLTRRGPVEDAELAASREQSESQRADVFRRLSEDAQAAVRLGVPPGDVRAALRAGGVGQDDARDLLAGRYEPYKPNRALEFAFRRKVKAVPIEGGTTLEQFQQRKRKAG